jgi:hypothetical protein
VRTAIATDYARAVELGFVCESCGAEFVRAHNCIVACAYCVRRYKENGGLPDGVSVAIHDEVNKAAHATEARKRREQRKNRNG